MQLNIKKYLAVFLVAAVLFGAAGVFAQDYRCGRKSCRVGSISVSTSPNSPTGEQDASYSLQTLKVFRVQAYNEPVRIREVKLTFNGGPEAEGTIDSVGIYNNAGTLKSSVARLYSSAWDNTPAVQQFTLDAVIQAGEYADFYIKGVTGNITGPDPARIQIRLAGDNGASVSGTGLYSKQAIISSTSLGLPLLTVRLEDNDESPGISNSRSAAAVEVRYDWRGILYAGSEDRQWKGLSITANNYRVGITELTLIVDNRVIASKVADSDSGSRTMTLSSSDLIGSGFTFDERTSSKIWIVVRANGVTGFRGNISVPGYSLPFSIFR
ncbi:MAG: hypothetical protein WC926_03575 [Candidatus Paceibacterota bacterium]|jgi:hypothetical protein